MSFSVFLAAARDFGNSVTGFSVLLAVIHNSGIKQGTDHFIFDGGGEGGWANVFCVVS